MNCFKLFLFLTLIATSVNQGFGWEYPVMTDELPYEEGLGTAESPYVIKNAQQLANLAFYVNNGSTYEGAYFKLGCDIDLNPGIVFDPDDVDSYVGARAWTPIGSKNCFKGNLDGGNHVIKGVYLKGDNVHTYYGTGITEGLFGYIEDCTLSDLTISNSLIAYDVKEQVISFVTAAFFAAESMNCNFYNLKNEGNVCIAYDGGKFLYGTSFIVAGIVANANRYSSSRDLHTEIKGCENYGTMRLSSDNSDSFNLAGIDCGFGGIVGDVNYSKLTDCRNYGNLDGDGLINCGGIGISVYGDINTVFSGLSNKGDINGGAGFFIFGGADTLKDSHNTGNITNGCGMMNDCQFLNIENCYNTGNIDDKKGRGVNGTGGLIGYSDYLQKMEDCYNTGNVYSSQSAAGLIGYGSALYELTLRNCYNTGNIESENSSAGGLLGGGINGGSVCGSIENCLNTGIVKGIVCCGGIAGSSGPVSFLNCRNEGNVEAISFVGGIVGKSAELDIMDSSNTGDITAGADYLGRSYCGGLVGECLADVEHVISRSFNTGNVQGKGDYVGGIGGGVSVVSECYNVGSVSGKTYVAGIAGSSAYAPDGHVILNAYNAGSVTGDDFVSGLCSRLDGGARYCFNYGAVKCLSENRALLWIYGYMMFEGENASECYSLPQDAFPVSLIYVGADSSIDKEDGCETRTAKEFSSGSVCVLLNGDQDPAPWGQDPESDPYPLLNGKGNPEMGDVDVLSVYDLKTIDRVYTIDGRLIMLDGQDNFGSLPSGIYIVNGRKIAIP